jgi:SAM-dependent methyltransferase
MATLLAPISEALLDHFDPTAAEAALDVGCGGGSGTLLLAGRMRPSAHVLGVDISSPLLEVARAQLAQRDTRGARVDFLEGDASTHDFGAAAFDLLFSRFGVMFFDDPALAFTRLRRAMRPGARLAFCCWQHLADNPWTALPLAAARQVLPPMPAPAPNAPGPFAFADADHVRGILAAAGWQAVDLTPRRIELHWPGRDLPTAVRELVNTGPVGRLLAPVGDAEREAVYAAAEASLAEHYSDGGLELAGAVWLVTAASP